jgi:hypothetical protein
MAIDQGQALAGGAGLCPVQSNFGLRRRIRKEGVHGEAMGFPVLS